MFGRSVPVPFNCTASIEAGTSYAGRAMRVAVTTMVCKVCGCDGDAACAATAGDISTATIVSAASAPRVAGKIISRIASPAVGQSVRDYRIAQLGVRRSVAAGHDHDILFAVVRVGHGRGLSARGKAHMRPHY